MDDWNNIISLIFQTHRLFSIGIVQQSIMLKTTQVTHKYTYINAENGRVCNFYIVKVKCDAQTPAHRRPIGAPHTSECWITGWNPMPIAGKFQSSFDVFNRWMMDNGWFTSDHPIEIIVEKERVFEVTKEGKEV